MDDNDNDSDYNPENDDQSYDSETNDEDDEATTSDESDNQAQELADDMALPEEADPAEVPPQDEDPVEDHNLGENTGVEQHEAGYGVAENEVVEIPEVDTQSDDSNDEAHADDHDPEEGTDHINQWMDFKHKGFSPRAILSNEKSAHITCITRTTHLRCPSSHPVYDTAPR